MTEDAQGEALAALRAEIDRIDAAMHALLMERGAVIGRLIAAKRTGETGSAFRPDREAAMMRRLAERHAGMLPLDAPEAIWRVIISSFTFVQAPFAVHGEGSAGTAAMRDAARFHFGFTAPFVAAADPAAVVAAVAGAPGDLGLVALAAPGSWWRTLEGDGAPKIIARLRFIERPGHPAGTPVLVLARTAAEPGPGGVAIHSCAAAGDLRTLPADVEILAAADGRLLVAAGADLTPLQVREQLEGGGLVVDTPVPVGSAPARFRL